MFNKLCRFYKLSNLKLHYPKGFAKVFKIEDHLSTVDIVNLIKSEEPNFKDVKITMGDKDVTD